MGFLELRQEPGVYSRVTAGMSIQNSSLFIEVKILSRYEGHGDVRKLSMNVKLVCENLMRNKVFINSQSIATLITC